MVQKQRQGYIYLLPLFLQKGMELFGCKQQRAKDGTLATENRGRT